MFWLEAAGIIVITTGVIAASLQFVAGLRRRAFDEAYTLYRRRVGQAILLGLELLVAADIIGTVAVEPTLRSVGRRGPTIFSPVSKIVRRRFSRWSRLARAG